MTRKSSGRPSLARRPPVETHLLAAGEAEGVLLPDPVHRAGVDRDGGVQVGVAEERAGREAAAGVGRELRLDHPRHIRRA